MSQRIKRIESAVKREISTLIQTELRDPRIGFITITKVEVTPDLKLAKIYYTVLGDEKSKKSTSIALNNAKKFLKKCVGDALGLRYVPDISFRYDKSMEYTQHIYDILEKIKKEDDPGKSNEQ